jgi:transcriptional regulator with XRE-family HTH domain
MNNIKHYRLLRGMTQDELSDIVDVRQAHISRIEKGGDEAEGVPIRLYRDIAAALRVEVSDLFASELVAAELSLIEAFRGSPDAVRRMMLAMAQEARSHEPPADQSASASDTASTPPTLI